MQLTSKPGSSRHVGRRVVLWGLLLMVGAEFVVRGPVRYLHPTNWNDLAQYYATSRIWLRGQNFANPENFAALWRTEVGESLSAGTARMHIAPPPGALVLFAPIAALPWPAAKVVWLGLLLASFGLTVWSLIRTAGLDRRQPRALAFIAGCLALAPFHTGIASANQTIFVVGCCAGGIWAAGVEADVLAGLLFGVACSLKPHIAAFVVLYYFLRRRWRLVATAVGVTIILAFIAVAWMQFANVTWFPDYVNNIKFGAARNRIDDFSAANPIRFMLINLQVPYYSFTHSATSANLLALGSGACLIAGWMILLLRQRTQHCELLALGTIAVIGLLPLYHRLYDASLLAITLCWCLSARNNLKSVSNAALLLMAPFLVPGAALLQQAARTGQIPDTWTHSWWWDRLLMPHQTWLLLLLSIVLLYGMAKQSGDDPEAASQKP
jgi:hypothetical protein